MLSWPARVGQEPSFPQISLGLRKYITEQTNVEHTYSFSEKEQR